MPRSKTCLPDINVWIALVSQHHKHAAACGEWFGSLKADQAVFCRVSQMGLLRLLTQKAVMGADVLSSRKAWTTYEGLLSDERINFEPEPAGLQQEWKKLTARDRSMPRVWTDAYLAAFAQAGGLRVVTLDRAVLSLTADALLLI
jgi:toxin-antitoxin system PIN domain toxin